jgi:N-ethylmaleimide reductase
MAQTMRAVRIHHYGGPEAMRLDAIAQPRPGAGEVLVQAVAFGINPVDWKIREGLRRDRLTLDLPAVLGCDLSGRVAAVGEGVAGFAPGQDVFAMTGLHGAFAEFVSLPADQVVARPSCLDHLHAAAVPLAALTAWQALRMGGIAPGRRVLIHAAAGGVGGFAVQIAHALGAEVIGTASAGNAAHVRGLGADRVIDYREARFEDAVADVDLVFDLVGGETQDRSWQVLRPDGVLISAVGVPPEGDPRPGGHRNARVGVRPVGADLAAIARLIEDGKLRVHLDAVMPMAEAAEALERNRLGHTRGKIVLAA